MAKNVKNGAGMLVLALACVAVVPARAELTPYAGIAERNVFGLHEEKSDSQPVSPKPEAANVKLAGITTIFGMKQALLVVNTPLENGKAPASQSVTLAEGQEFGNVQVLQINPEARTVKVRSDKLESLLELKTPAARK